MKTLETYLKKVLNEDLAQWEKLPLSDRLGYVYVQTFNDGGKYYFHPVEIQKNGGIKGVGFGTVESGGRISGKAKNMSVPKSDFSWWKKTDYKKVDKKIINKIAAKLK